MPLLHDTSSNWSTKFPCMIHFPGFQFQHYQHPPGSFPTGSHTRFIGTFTLRLSRLSMKELADASYHQPASHRKALAYSVDTPRFTLSIPDGNHSSFCTLLRSWTEASLRRMKLMDWPQPHRFLSLSLLPAPATCSFNLTPKVDTQERNQESFLHRSRQKHDPPVVGVDLMLYDT